MCGGGAYFHPVMLLFVPFGYLMEIPVHLKNQYEKMIKDMEHSLLKTDLMTKNMFGIQKESKFKNSETYEFEKCFKLSILGKKKEFKDMLLELEATYTQNYIPSFLLAQYYYVKKKYKKALHHAKMADVNYRTYESTDVEQEIIVAKDQFNDLTKVFVDYWNGLLNVHKTKITNRFNLLNQDFGNTFLHGITDGISKTKSIFSSKLTKFVQVEDFYDIIGSIYYENSYYDDALSFFQKVIDISASGDRTKLGGLYYHLSLVQFFRSDYGECYKAIKESYYYGFQEDVCLIIQSLTEFKLNQNSESKKNKEKAISMNKKLGELYDELLNEKSKQEKQKEALEKEKSEREELEKKLYQKALDDLKNEFNITENPDPSQGYLYSLTCERIEKLLESK